MENSESTTKNTVELLAELDAVEGAVRSALASLPDQHKWLFVWASRMADLAGNCPCGQPPEWTDSIYSDLGNDAEAFEAVVETMGDDPNVRTLLEAYELAGRALTEA